MICKQDLERISEVVWQEPQGFSGDMRAAPLIARLRKPSGRIRLVEYRAPAAKTSGRSFQSWRWLHRHPYLPKRISFFSPDLSPRRSRTAPQRLETPLQNA